MPRTPRKFLFDPAEIGVYHCVFITVSTVVFVGCWSSSFRRRNWALFNRFRPSRAQKVCTGCKPGPTRQVRPRSPPKGRNSSGLFSNGWNCWLASSPWTSLVLRL